MPRSAHALRRAALAQRRPASVRSGAAPAPSSAPRDPSAPPDPSTAQIAQIQRLRLIAAAAAVIDADGYAHTTVARVTARARVSRRTFYELFENREACLVALVELVVARVEQQLDLADLAALPWRERVRGGLEVILAFLDREPVLARVCVVHALQGGPRVLVQRERVHVRLAAALDEGRRESSRTTDGNPLTAEGLVGAAFGILYARLARPEHEPLAGLLGELMGLIVLPYRGPAAARREQTRTARVVATPLPSPPRPPAPPVADPLGGLPMRLTYRTARVLAAIASHPGASNRVVAGEAGISDQGQISKLLARLERLGLVEKTGGGATKGEPNAWTLTALGREVSRQLSTSTCDQKEAA